MTEISPSAILRAIAEELHMDFPLGDTDADAGVFAAHQVIHDRLLTIAAELDLSEDDDDDDDRDHPSLTAAERNPSLK
jgi:hypothetical protein